MTDPVTAKAIRLIEEKLEGVRFDLSENARQTIQTIDRRSELQERERALLKLLRMHGGVAAEYAPERERVG